MKPNTIRARRQGNGNKATTRTTASKRIKWDPKRGYELIQRLMKPSIDALYSVSYEDFRKAHGKSYLKLFNDSPQYAIMVNLPDTAWKLWRFKHSNKFLWENISPFMLQNDPIVRTFVWELLHDYCVDLGLNKLSDLLNIPPEKLGERRYRTISKLGGMHTLIDIAFGTVDAHTPMITRFRIKPTKDHWKSSRNRYEYIQALKNYLGGSISDLYSVKRYHFLETGGAGLLGYFNSQPMQVIMHEYPDHAWEIWKFEKSPHWFWSEISIMFLSGRIEAVDIVQRYLEHLQQKYGVDEIVDLNSVALDNNDSNHLRMLGGIQAIIERINSPIDSLQVHNDWHIPRLLNDAIGEKEKYLGNLLKIVGGSMEGLYSLTREIVEQTGGTTLLRKYNNSVALMVIGEWPQYKWRLWRFPHVPSSQWRLLGERVLSGDREAQDLVKEFCTELATSWGISRPEDFYCVMSHQLAQSPWPKLGIPLDTYLRISYPSIKWKVWKFKFNDHYSWWHALGEDVLAEQQEAIETARQYLEELEATYMLHKCEDWYDAMKNRFPDTEVLRLRWLQVEKVLPRVFPNRPFKPWRLGELDHSWWAILGQTALASSDHPNNQLLRLFVEELESVLGIKNASDWYRIRRSQIPQTYLNRIEIMTGRKATDGLFLLLQAVHPSHEWKYGSVLGKARHEQRFVTRTVGELL